MNIEREALIRVLEQVKPALAASGSVEGLKHIWLDKKYLYAYDGALGIRIAWESGLQPCGLPGSVLLGILHSSSVKEISLEQQGASLTVKMGRSTTKLSTMPLDENPWPFPPTVPASTKLTLELTEDLIMGLRRARAIKASNPVRVEHYGVSLFPSKGVLTLYTTDSKTLAEITVEGNYAKELNKQVLPHAFVAQLLTLKPPAKISFLKDAIIAERAGIQVCSNLLDSASVWDLPKLADQTIGDEPERMALPDSLGEALNRAVVLAGPDEAFINLSVVKKDLELSGTFKLGVLQERFPLGGKPTVGEMVLELASFKALAKEAKEFAFGEKALVLYGDEGVLYLISPHSEGK